jgi:hypothetical protein
MFNASFSDRFDSQAHTPDTRPMCRTRIGNPHPLQDTLIIHHPQDMDSALHRIATLKMALQPPLLPRKATQGFFNSMSGKNVDQTTSFPQTLSGIQSSGK